MKKKEVTLEAIELLLKTQREEFERYVAMVAEEYQERLKAATELIPSMHEDIRVLKEDVSDLKYDMNIVKNRLGIATRAPY